MFTVVGRRCRALTGLTNAHSEPFKAAHAVWNVGYPVVSFRVENSR